VSVCGWDRIGWLTWLYCREQLAALEGCKAELAQLTWSTAENISPWRRSRLSSPCRAAPEHEPATRRGSWETLTLHTQSGCRSNSSDGSHRRRRDRSRKYCRMRRKCRPTLRSATYSEQKPSRTAREAVFSWSILHQWLLTIRKLKKSFVHPPDWLIWPSGVPKYFACKYPLSISTFKIVAIDCRKLSNYCLTFHRLLRHVVFHSHISQQSLKTCLEARTCLVNENPCLEKSGSVLQFLQAYLCCFT